MSWVWGTVWGGVVKAKLGFVGRLGGMKKDKRVSDFFRLRWAQVSEGNRRGVMVEVKEILEKYGGMRADRVWNAIGKVSKGKLKRLIADFVIEMEERMWEE